MFHECPSMFHECPSLFHECPSMFHECPSMFHECTSLFHENDNNKLKTKYQTVGLRNMTIEPENSKYVKMGRETTKTLKRKDVPFVL
jgi:hypothetical protein